jgi:isoquinoline 1-oxidoreductase beta subunit
MNDLANNGRRSFLKTGVGLGTGLIISFMIPAKAGRLKNILSTGPTVATFSPNAFLSIGTDNKIKVLLAHAEMGQGIWTTLTMLIAEELDADFKDIEVEHAPADKAFFHSAWGMQLTGGSSTTWSEFDRYRKVLGRSRRKNFTGTGRRTKMGC